MTIRYKLSKSRFLSGFQCQKKLWLEKHHPELKAVTPDSQQAILDQGTRVGELAREQFRDGVLIEADYDEIPLALKQTVDALSRGFTTIFEGCFIHNEILVRPDVLVQDESGSWQLIEVKSTTRVKDEHLVDVAIQKYVLDGCGIEIQSCHLMHIDTACVFPDMGDLFEVEDITEDVEPLLEWIPVRAIEYFQTLESKDEPERQIGEHCKSPYECPFIPHCWKHVPEYSVFTIPRFGWIKKQNHIDQDVLQLEEVDESVLNEKQLRYQQSYREQRPIIDQGAIHAEVSRLNYPIYFLDFETEGPAIPWIDGMHPFEQFPFQFSCHILTEEGTLTHEEYLHQNQSDPRISVAQALVDTINPQGSIVAYNAPFEKRFIKNLAFWAPTLARDLKAMLPRFWDQLVIFRNYYTDFRFHGSASIKDVLPVIVPGLSYKDLPVSDGGLAQLTWNKYIRSTNESERAELRRDLLDYCGQDTFAMVEIHRYLVNVTSN